VSGRLLGRMSQRLGALLLMLVVAGAPAALTVCEIVCAARGSQSSSVAHSCHGTQPSYGAHIDAGAQLCGHEDALPTAAMQAMLLLASPPAVAGAGHTLNAHEDGTIHRAHAITSSPADSSSLPRPLRI
jgi:hypothetical protein